MCPANVPLLANSHHSADKDVENQAGGQEQHEHAEHHRHHILDHFLLGSITTW